MTHQETRQHQQNQTIGIDQAVQLSQQWISAGKFTEAEALLRKVVDAAPRHDPALHLLAISLHQQKRSEEAVSFLQKAIEVKAYLSNYHNNLGLVLSSLGRLDEALKAYQNAILLDKHNPDYFSNISSVYHKRKDYAQAELNARRALAFQSDSAEAHCNLANALVDQDRLEEAVKHYKIALGLQPALREAITGLGKVYREQKEMLELIGLCEKFIEIDPLSPEPYVQMGTAYRSLGKMDEAEQALERALEIDPENIEALYAISELKKFQPDDASISTAENLLTHDDLPRKKRIPLHFALGKMYKDIKVFDKSFAHFRQGGKLVLEQNSGKWDPDQFKKQISILIDNCGQQFFKDRKNVGIDSTKPIFIFGMPRSGTTLTEQIISSHPKVFGAGELTLVADILNRAKRFSPLTSVQLMNNFQPREYQAFAKEYLHKAEALVTTDEPVQHITDKMPGNFLQLWFIALMFPKATFIHCRRNPLDNLISCFTKYFTAGHYYSYELQSLGQYYREYRRLMDHWKKVLPIDMLELNYEDLVVDQENMSRRLIAHCGLDWDDRCLEFHTSTRPIFTASASQVRQKIYKTAMGRWREYETQLTPLIDALGEYAFEKEAL